ncbi:MAG: BON domain-containing protein [Chloroflexota bacterium]
MSKVEQQSLVDRLERELEAQAGINAVVEVKGDELVLSGRVDTPEARQAAEDIVSGLVQGKRINNGLEVETVRPQAVSDFYAGEAPSAEPPESLEEIREQELEIDPDFSDQALSTSGLASAGVDTLEEKDTVFFPPTDPVITSDEKGEAKVLGGFSPTSTTSVDVARSASDAELGDEAIVDAVQRELREDAATTDLVIDIIVRQGVVHLRGTVRHLDDAENAQAVAGRVPGVSEVVDELTVSEI